MLPTGERTKSMRKALYPLTSFRHETVLRRGAGSTRPRIFEYNISFYDYGLTESGTRSLSMGFMFVCGVFADDLIRSKAASSHIHCRVS